MALMLKGLFLGVLLSVLGQVGHAREGSAATPHADVVKAAQAWIDGLEGKAYKTTIRSADGSPLATRAINNRLFAMTDGPVYIGVGFSTAPKATSTLADLKRSLRHVALDKIPVPGVAAKHWETRLQTPVSSFKKGVTVESFSKGVLRLRVQTTFFAAYGRRTNILLPADAGMPKGTYFQIRKPIKADLIIECQLFPAP